jgi:outer membrane protein assembly factor BamB
MFGLGLFLALAGRAQTDGSIDWPFTTLSSAQAGAILSAPTIDDQGVIYFGLEIGNESSANPRGRVIALNANGILKWSFDTPDWVDASPLVGRGDSTLYVGCWDGVLYALDRSTGTVKWTYDTGGFISATSSQGPDGTLYVPGGDGSLYALSTAGELKWSFVATDWIQSSPTVAADGVIYFGSWDDTFYALSPTGQLLWSALTGGDVVGSAAIAADGTVIFGSRDRFVYALNLDGSLRWSLDTGDSVEASPVISADGTIYIGSSSGKFFALTPDGNIKWQKQLTKAIYGTAAIRADGSVVVGASDFKLHAWSSSGAELWTTELGDWVDSSPVVGENGRLYVGSHDKKLYSIVSSSGSDLNGDWPQFQRTARRDGWQMRGSTGTATGKLQNLSVRTTAGTGSQTLVAGFVVEGSGTRSILLRGVGPTLASSFGLTGVLSDPRLTLYAPSGAEAGSNDNWFSASNAAAISSAAATLGAFPLGAQSLDAAALANFGAGPSSVHITGANATPGIALVEAYDAGGDDGTRLINVSARSQVGTGSAVLIAGFVIDESMTLLIRGVGPALASFGVEGVLADPVVRIFDTAGLLTQSNNAGTTSDALMIAAEAQALGAFALPTNALDAALIVTLPAGVYSAVVEGANGGTGVGLIEVYVLSPGGTGTGSRLYTNSSINLD